MNNKMNFLENGKTTALIIKVTDKEKAYDFIGKSLLGKIDNSNHGFIVENVYLSEDTYKEFISKEMEEDLLRSMEEYSKKAIKETLEKYL